MLTGGNVPMLTMATDRGMESCGFDPPLALKMDADNLKTTMKGV